MDPVSATPTEQPAPVPTAGRGRLALLAEIATLKAEKTALQTENDQLRHSLEEALKPKT